MERGAVFILFVTVLCFEATVGQRRRGSCRCQEYQVAVSCDDRLYRSIPNDPCPGREIYTRRCSGNCNFVGAGQNRCGTTYCNNSRQTTRRSTPTRMTTRTMRQEPTTISYRESDACGVWSEWTTCSTRCRGTMTRYRQCSDVTLYNTENSGCSLDNPATCLKDGEQQVPEDIILVGYSPWTTGACRTYGDGRRFQRRTRSCSYPEIRPCDGPAAQYIRC